ncbi:MAG TPA: tripartite tricarboxylate transporter substrate binding protein [Usitatibacter sp.]|nr:tripartite tricarboxylate transporter substrate binding protein [Usitatibacter sp.]
MGPTLRIAFAALALALPSLASAQAWPTRPIRMIIPLAAASAVDNAARVVAQHMSATLGQQVVIENQPGASGQIGADKVAKSAPDGYTIGGFNDSIMTMLPNLYPDKLPWDTLRDFEPVSLVATVEWGLVAGNNTPYRTAADLIADAKARPGKIDYGSGGIGSPQHIAMALFASTAGIELTHVPYKGATQAALGVAGGEVPVAFQGIATVTSLVRSGKVRLIGVATPARLAQFPEVPRVAESGLAGFAFNSWFTIVAPAGTPKDIVAKLNRAIVQALADPQVRARLNDQGLTPRGSSPEELAKATREQLARYRKLFQEAGIKAE